MMYLVPVTGSLKDPQGSRSVTGMLALLLLGA
eukprot:CAMPEP_0183376306 /NCGR_PEP_ID=MMETSP0164_2-20130417/119908_1 /TAXON_ID=221442 /ORGANISM="Coccolithus pelagicus ssp braarudi, Strain PLY182g" /LENGTH=31 /DNA_ID= /DNA_START= /DNA_END= /DNA_ORIENTATION=